MSAKVVILYEDQRTQLGSFGLHDFVCQLVIDQCGLQATPFDLRKTQVLASPQKGAGNVRKECQRRMKTFVRQFHRVFAVYDEDEAHALAKITSDSCRPKICERLTEGCVPLEHLEIVLIRQNVESLISVARDFQPAFLNLETADRAINRKDLIARDSVFQQCLKQSVDTRTALMQQMPDLARLVRKISEVLQSSQSSNP